MQSITELAQMLNDNQDSSIINSMLLDDFKECLENCVNCPALVGIKQIYETANGEKESADIEQFVVDCINNINIDASNGYIYYNLHAEKQADFRKIYSTWKNVLSRGTFKFHQGEDNDYVFMIDLIKEDSEKSLAYNISFVAPIFVGFENEILGSENEGLMLVYGFDNMRFAKTEIDYVQVYDELQYAKEVEKAAEEREIDDSNNTFDENNGIISNDEYLL